MARKVATFVERDRRWLGQGKGLGRGNSYLPFLNVRSGPHSDVARHDGHVTGRIHHSFGPYEPIILQFFDALDIYDRDLVVTDILEQYPLVPTANPATNPTAVTREIAERLGIPHPPKSRADDFVVLTTDLVVFMHVGARELVLALCIKLSADLEDVRVRQKLEIERRYWQDRRLDGRETFWYLVTERDVPRRLVDNLSRLARARSIKTYTPPESSMTERIRTLLEEALDSRPLGRVAREVDRKLALQPGTAIDVAYWLIAVRRWHVDLVEHRVHPDERLVLLKTGESTEVTSG